jgi:hypothetical protein
VSSGGTNSQSGDCSGSASFFFSQAYMTSEFLQPGTPIFVQWWFRDPNHVDGTGIGLSDAVHFVVQM